MPEIKGENFKNGIILGPREQWTQYLLLHMHIAVKASFRTSE
jgi:hypothetical protein